MPTDAQKPPILPDDRPPFDWRSWGGWRAASVLAGLASFALFGLVLHRPTGLHFSWLGVTMFLFFAVKAAGQRREERQWKRQEEERREVVRVLSGEPPTVMLGPPGRPIARPDAPARVLPVERALEQSGWRLGWKELLLAPLAISIGVGFWNGDAGGTAVVVLGLPLALAYLIVLRIDREVRDQ